MRKLTPLMQDALIRIFAERDHWLKLDSHRLGTLVGLIERGLITPLVPFWSETADNAVDERGTRHHVLTSAGIDWLLDNAEYGHCEPLDLVRQKERDVAHAFAIDEDRERMHGPAMNENAWRTTADRAYRAGDRKSLVKLRQLAEREGRIDLAERVIRPMIERTITANIERAVDERRSQLIEAAKADNAPEILKQLYPIEVPVADFVQRAIEADHAETATERFSAEAAAIRPAAEGECTFFGLISNSPCVLPADHGGRHALEKDVDRPQVSSAGWADAIEDAAHVQEYETAEVARLAEEHAAELARRELPVSREQLDADHAEALLDPRADRYGADGRWTRTGDGAYRLGPDVPPVTTASTRRPGQFALWLVDTFVAFVEWNGETWAPVDKPLCDRPLFSDRTCVREFGHYGLCTSRADVAAMKADVETRRRPGKVSTAPECGRPYFDGYVSAEQICVMPAGHTDEHRSSKP